MYFPDAKETLKSLENQRTKNMKVIQEKMNLDKKEMKRFNPVSSDINLHYFFLFQICEADLMLVKVIIFYNIFQVDAFPGDIVIFGRVLNLLRGLLPHTVMPL
jgi:aarF domain-containing kinase